MKGWTHYEGKCDVEDLVAAIEECGTRIGMESRCDRPSSNEYAIRSIQQRHWLAVIWFGLPQDVRWIVRSSDSRTSLFYDRRSLPWARNLALCSCLTAPLFLWISVSDVGGKLDTEDASTIPFRILSLMSFFGAMFLSHRLLFASRSLDHCQETILAIIGTFGGNLEEYPTESFTRQTRLHLVYAGYAVLASVTVFIMSPSSPNAPKMPVPAKFILLLLAFVCCSLASMLVVLRKNQSNDRMLSMFPVIPGLLAALTWKLSILPIYLVCVISDSTNVRLQWTCVSSAGLGAFMAGIAIGAFYWGLSDAAIVQRKLNRVKFHSDSRLAFRTGTGGQLLSWLQYCGGGIAAFLGTLVLFATWNSLAIGIFASCNIVIPSYPEDITRIVDGSFTIMCGMLRQPATTEYLFLGVVSRVFWMIYGLALPSLVALSVGGLIWSRQRLRRRLLENELIGFTEHDRILRHVDALAKRAGVRRPRISVTPTKSCSLLSHTFGILRREHWIELSDGFLTLFDGDHKNASLSAALAHEMAHQRLGHCLRNNILRCVARALFIGDGFVLSLVNSYQNELKADQIAVREFQVDPVDLRKALWLVSDCMSAEVVTSKTALTGIEFVPSQHTLYDRFLRDGPQGLSFLERWKVYIVCFLGSYTGGDRLSYWHPHPDERVKRLRLLEE